MNKLLLFAAIFAGRVSPSEARPADSIPEPEQLQQVEVRATAPRRLLRHDSGGRTLIDAAHLGEQASFMGAPDAVALLRTLPAVATAAELQASFDVRGSGTGSSLFMADGVRVINPMHMLGLYSAFNPAYYRNYSFRAGRIPATEPSVTAGVFSAVSVQQPDTVCSGSVTLGLIESHGAVSLPLWRGASLALGARTTYLDKVFPQLLTLGGSRLGYRFSDVDVSLTARTAGEGVLHVSFFGDADRLLMTSDKQGSKAGEFGWRNMAGGVGWTGRRLRLQAGVSRYSNTFGMEQGGFDLSLPSSMTQLSLSALVAAGDFTLGADGAYRYCSGQNGHGGGRSGEFSLAAEWMRELSPQLRLEAGLRLSAYVCGGYRTFLPLPRAAVVYRPDDAVELFAAYGRRTRFDRLVEESANGLPADFWTCATAALPPEQSHDFEAGAAAFIPGTGIRCSVEGYYRLLRDCAEFTGSLLNLASDAYNPLDDLSAGRGYACGLSLAAMRQSGSLRWRLSYNYGHTRLRLDRYGREYFPSAHDRPHDLNLSLGWSLWRGLTLSASYTLASGTPYTAARYGYMIGENLICEYYPHNSSRLPDYHRLDLSATYRFGSGQLRHAVNLSVYNALANHNVLMRYYSYSVIGGIERMESVMKSVIPSVMYTLSF
ncbi:MAG: TonB-dependent receptor [Muribaculaceae bacterium]|nr:TonB-dependent receptor [Muribaculaceae bacterium]